MGTDLNALMADAERLCWALRPLVRMVPAGDTLCWVRFKVGVQEFTIGSEPLPEDEAAHFAGLFVFALAAAFRTTGWEKCAEPGSWHCGSAVMGMTKDYAYRRFDSGWHRLCLPPNPAGVKGDGDGR